MQKPDDAVCQVEFNFTGPFMYDPNSWTLEKGLGTGWRPLDYHLQFDEDLKTTQMYTPAPTSNLLHGG